jgi:hypothetical protein
MSEATCGVACEDAGCGFRLGSIRATLAGSGSNGALRQNRGNNDDPIQPNRSRCHGVHVPSSAALAQTAPPTYQGDPDVYKVIFENDQFRVIAATRKKGVHDRPHGHPLPSIIYFVDDCKTKQYAAGGKTSEAESKAGTAQAVPIIASHSAENTGPNDCHQIFVERK